MRILLAEDNLVNQTVAVRLLEKRGYTVVVAGNGRAALAALEQNNFDLVLMDVQMPELDGFETTVAIRAKEELTGAHIPIVAMTAHALKGDQERCMASGMDGYLSKPIPVEELLAIVEDQLVQSQVCIVGRSPLIEHTEKKAGRGLHSTGPCVRRASRFRFNLVSAYC